jgi:hypothetical protein
VQKLKFELHRVKEGGAEIKVAGNWSGGKSEWWQIEVVPKMARVRKLEFCEEEKIRVWLRLCPSNCALVTAPSQHERQIALLDPITSPPRNRPHQVLLLVDPTNSTHSMTDAMLHSFRPQRASPKWN